MGGFIIFPLKHRTSFQVEGGFSKSGRSWTYKPNSSKWTSTYNFIDLSMSLKRSFTLRIFRNVPSEWYIGAGPNINYWLGGKGKWVPHLGPDTPPGIISNFKVVFDNPNPPLGSHLTNIYVNRENRWLYGINLSIGTSWTTLKNQRFFTELRLMWGQTYLGKKDSELLGSPEAAPQMSLKCNLKTLSFSIGYIFDRDIQRGKMGKSTKKLK